MPSELGPDLVPIGGRSNRGFDLLRDFRANLVRTELALVSREVPEKNPLRPRVSALKPCRRILGVVAIPIVSSDSYP